MKPGICEFFLLSLLNRIFPFHGCHGAASLARVLTSGVCICKQGWWELFCCKSDWHRGHSTRDPAGTESDTFWGLCQSLLQTLPPLGKWVCLFLLACIHCLKQCAKEVIQSISFASKFSPYCFFTLLDSYKNQCSELWLWSIRNIHVTAWYSNVRLRCGLTLCAEVCSIRM
jgi:hypothetical protein